MILGMNCSGLLIKTNKYKNNSELGANPNRYFV